MSSRPKNFPAVAFEAILASILWEKMGADLPQVATSLVAARMVMELAGPMFHTSSRASTTRC